MYVLPFATLQATPLQAAAVSAVPATGKQGLDGAADPWDQLDEPPRLSFIR